MYVSSHKGSRRHPRKRWREFIEKKIPGAATDDLFRSNRDSEPYVVSYGSAGMTGPARVFAHEKTGRDGKRYVAFGTTECSRTRRTSVQEGDRRSIIREHSNATISSQSRFTLIELLVVIDRDRDSNRHADPCCSESARGGGANTVRQSSETNRGRDP